MSSRSSASSGILQVQPLPQQQQLKKSTVVDLSPDRGVKFLDGSTLQKYLVERVPHLVSFERKTYTLHEVLHSLKEAILVGSLFDPRNPSIVVCDEHLENVLGARALHTMEVRERVCKHLELEYSDQVLEDVATTATTTAAAMAPEPQPHPASLKNYQALLGGHTFIHGLNSCVSSSTTTCSHEGNDVKPSSSSSLSATASANVGDSFDLDAKYLVSPSFLKVIRAVKDVDQEQSIFSYKELTSYLSRYILANKERLFDARNHMVVICKGDPLGESFGVDAFHRTQVSCLLMRQLVKVPSEMDGEVGSRKRQPSPDSSLLKGPSFDATESKRQRRKSSLSVTIQLECSSDDSRGSSEHEDEKFEVDGSSGSEDGDFKLFTFERVYSEEFEPGDSDSADDIQDNPSSCSDDSDMEGAVLLASVVFSNETDLAEWADSSGTNDNDSDFALANYDPETENETWKCVNCLTPNIPYIRYCSRCWKERKGWVPERSNPRRRKRKDKRTEGMLVKKSGGGGGGGSAIEPVLARQTSTSDSGVCSQASQDLSPNDECASSIDEDGPRTPPVSDGEEHGNQQSMTCTFCCLRPKDASFIHGRISHQVCCYKCAKKLFKKKRSCPVCRRKIEKITKHIVA